MICSKPAGVEKMRNSVPGPVAVKEYSVKGGMAM